MLKEIGNALVQADVNIKLVLNLRKNLKESLKLEKMPGGIDKRTAITKVF